MTTTDNNLTRRQAIHSAGGIWLVASMGGVLAACGSSSDDSSSEGGLLTKVQDEGTITVGFANEAPYSFEDGGELVGADAELAKRVLTDLGVDNVKTVLVDFDSLIPALAAGRFDMIAAGQFITPERCAEIAFSQPHYCIDDALAVKPGNPKELSDYKSVASSGARLGLTSGATEVDRAKAAGVSDDQIQLFEDALDGLDALKGGRIDAYGNSSVSLYYQVERTQQKNEVETLPSFKSVIDGKTFNGCAGFGFRSKDLDLRDAFDEGVKGLGPDQVTAIAKPYGFTAGDVKRGAGLTRKDLGC